MITTSLFWHSRNEIGNPPENKRILVFSPAYEIGDPMRLRLIDSQFYRLSKDAEYWAVVEEPCSSTDPFYEKNLQYEMD